MKKIIVAMLVVTLAKIALGDWAADYEAWRASGKVDASNRGQVLTMIENAPENKINLVLADWEPIAATQEIPKGGIAEEAVYILRLKKGVIAGKKGDKAEVMAQFQALKIISETPIYVNRWLGGGMPVYQQAVFFCRVWETGVFTEAEKEEQFRQMAESHATNPAVAMYVMEYMTNLENRKLILVIALDIANRFAANAEALDPVLGIIAKGYADGQVAKEAYIGILTKIIDDTTARMAALPANDQATVAKKCEAVKNRLAELQK